MPKIKVQIDRNASGIPSIATIRRGRKKLKIDFSPDTGFVIEGSSKSLPSFSEIARMIYPVQPVSVVVESGAETRVYRSVGSKAKSESVVLCDLPEQDVTLEHLEFASDYENSSLKVIPYKADGAEDHVLSLLSDTGGNLLVTHAANIHSHESILWLELKYDTTNDKYKFGLGYPLRFANGVKIRITNTDAVNAHVIGCVASILIRG